MTGDVLDVREAAEFLKMGRNAVYEAVSRNEIPHRRIGRSIRFSRAALLAWLGCPDRATVDPWSEQVAGEGS
jgi:excisionase family DNA binding protein